MNKEQRKQLFAGQSSGQTQQTWLTPYANLMTILMVFFLILYAWNQYLLKMFEKKFGDRIRLFGWQPHEKVSNFINAADVCIVPRHASKHSQFYNEENLFKITEYMLFGKPIVACGIAESSQYLLVKEDEMAEAIIRAMKDETPVSTPKTWEEHSEKKILELFSWLKSTFK